jgi:hypothetical protein
MLQLPRLGGSATLSVTDKAMTSSRRAFSHVHFPTYCSILLNLEKLGHRVAVADSPSAAAFPQACFEITTNDERRAVHNL